MLEIIIPILIFILILSVLVMLHEFGHFIMARRSGMGVEEFGFGLPPRAWGKKINGTIYSVNWLPFGGFVRLVGEDPTDKKVNAKNSFWVKPLGQRMAVVLAGVFMNLILGVVIFYIVLFALGFKVSIPLLTDHQFKFVDQSRQVFVEETVDGSPAERAGIKVGDSIFSVNGKKISSSEELLKDIRSSQDKPLSVVLENTVDNRRRTVQVTPTYNERLQAPAIGVSLGQIAVLSYNSLPQKAFSGFTHSYNVLEYSLKFMGKLIASSVKSGDIAPISEGVSGPIGIAVLTKVAVSLGPIMVLQLVALLSLNLAVMNVLPIPALDGGRFFFLVLEAITRRRVLPTVEKWVHTVGFVILITLAVVISYNDILKFLR